MKNDKKHQKTPNNAEKCGKYREFVISLCVTNFQHEINRGLKLGGYHTFDLNWQQIGGAYISGITRAMTLLFDPIPQYRCELWDRIKNGVNCMGRS